jgi:energy-coupling factor transporter ATP-binding protein EcfA2
VTFSDESEHRAASGLRVPGMGLACRDVSFSYDEGGVPVPALREVSFELPAGGSLALLGASGAGKSTLLQVLRGLDRVESGVVLLDGIEPDGEGYVERQLEVGLVFQVAELQPFASTARDDVAFGPRCLGWQEADVTAAVEAAFDLVDMPLADFGGRHPYSLSGGEQRRLALAGVLAMRPRLLLLDEPFVSLDPGTRRELVSILERLKADGVTLLLATHDVDLAWALCDERLLLADGRVAAAGDWGFGEDGGRLLAANRLREPFLVELWRRLGRSAETVPKNAVEAAEALV